MSHQNNNFPSNMSATGTTTTTKTAESTASSSSSSDFLNSSQTEKNWLNSSLNEKTSFLNSSWNLPPELRYKALTDLVSKIVEDESLMSSGNASTLLITNHDNHQTKAKSSSHNLNNRDRHIGINSQESHHTKSDAQSQYDQSVKTVNTNKPATFQYQHQQQNVQTQVIFSHPQNPGFDTNKKDFLPYGVGPPPPQQQHPPQHQTLIDRPNVLSFIPPTGSQLPPPAPQPPPNDMKLAYPPSYLHHLATLTPDQQNYLLQQQKELFMRLTLLNNSNANSSNNENNMIMNHHHHHHHHVPAPPPHMYYQQPVINQHSGNLPMKSSNVARTLSSSSKSSSESPSGPNLLASPQLNSKPTILMQENSLKQSPFIPYHIQNPEIHFPPVYKHPNEEMIMSTLIDPESLLKMNPNNENLKLLLAKQPNYRQHRRTGPANELHIRLEECLYQLKCLEIERKKMENELFHIGLSRSKFSSTPSQGSSPHSPSTQFRLPSNPSRVDKLIAECWREHSKVSLVVSRMDVLKTTMFMANIQSAVQLWLESIANVQARRKDELVKNANKARLNGAAGAHQLRFYDEKDVIVLAGSIYHLSQMLVKMRTSLWSACQIASLIESRNHHHQVVSNSAHQSESCFFDSVQKTKDFWQNYFTIKTDLVEINK